MSRYLNLLLWICFLLTLVVVDYTLRDLEEQLKECEESLQGVSEVLWQQRTVIDYLIEYHNKLYL